jgi:sucrose-6-phosphate hydrolase SacC (GH32 family)
MALYLEGANFALYASPDLKHWEHLQTFAIPGVSECPDFFEIPVDGDKRNTRWVYVAANGTYLVGRFDGQRFTVESDPLPSDRGANFYAVQTYSDVPDGRRIQIAWMNGGKYPDMPFNQQMSFPCELTLRAFPEGLRLCRNPVREIEKLHEAPRHWKDLTLKPGDNPLSDLQGDLFDLQMEIEPGDAKEIVLTLRGEAVRYSVSEKKLSFLGRSGELEPEDGRVKLRVLLDRTSIEAFGNGGKLSMSSCFVPQPEDRNLSLSAEGGSARIHSLTVYPLKSAWSHQKSHE